MPPIQLGEMTYLVLITVAAALLTGILSLPLTMPGRAWAAPLTAFGTAGALTPPTTGTALV